MEGMYQPEEWNFYEEFDLTTSNAAESTNWRFTVKTGSAHPNIYTSCAAIKNDIKETEHPSHFYIDFGYRILQRLQLEE